MFSQNDSVGTASITAPFPVENEQNVDPRGDWRSDSKFNRLKEGGI